jgi:hypothetical protein
MIKEINMDTAKIVGAFLVSGVGKIISMLLSKSYLLYSSIVGYVAYGKIEEMRHRPEHDQKCRYILNEVAVESFPIIKLV